jgi:hypothetical protein
MNGSPAVTPNRAATNLQYTLQTRARHVLQQGCASP